MNAEEGAGALFGAQSSSLSSSMPSAAHRVESQSLSLRPVGPSPQVPDRQQRSNWEIRKVEKMWDSGCPTALGTNGDLEDLPLGALQKHHIHRAH